jgi:hypothetical protein
MKSISRMAYVFTAAACLSAGCAAQGEAVDETSQAVLLETTIDQCSGQLSVISSSGSLVEVPRGEWTKIYVPSRFGWFCGSSQEATTCAPGTRYVWAYHSSENRQITWECNY